MKSGTTSAPGHTEKNTSGQSVYGKLPQNWLPKSIFIAIVQILSNFNNLRGENVKMIFSSVPFNNSDNSWHEFVLFTVWKEALYLLITISHHNNTLTLKPLVHLCVLIEELSYGSKSRNRIEPNPKQRSTSKEIICGYFYSYTLA